MKKTSFGVERDSCRESIEYYENLISELEKDSFGIKGKYVWFGKADVVSVTAGE